MKKTFLHPVLIALTSFLFNVSHAQETPAQATVTAVKGAATVKLADGSSVPATIGMKLDQGSAISTGKGAQVSLLVHEGIVAVMAGNTEVELEKLSVNANGKRNAMLSLKTGNLASSLDPSKKSINNYGVRTAKGVAMAQGTDLTVTVNGNVYLVAVINGNVQVTWAGGQSVSISGGTANAVTTNNNGTTTSGTLGTAMSAGGSAGLTDALTAAAAAVATLATSTTQITSLINTIAAAAGTSSTASNTVASITAAATAAAVTNTSLVGNNPSVTSTTSVASIISTAAVTASTAAGNGGAAQLIVNSAANALVNTVPATNLSAVATALTNASNNVAGNPTINRGLVIAGVNAPPNAGTPITPIAPIVSVSPSF
ncbi:MAG: hypothetical protein EXS37_07605 [Opitutus sp.]|nr:hypothetical protein [Opitutus sp.]